MLGFAAEVADMLVAVVGSAAVDIVDMLVVAPGTAATVVDIVHCADGHSPQTDSYDAATESDVLVLTIECTAPADQGVAAAAFVVDAALVAAAVGRIDTVVALVDKMVVAAAVSVEYSAGVGSVAVADFVAVAEVADADRVVYFAVAAESIGSVIVSSGFDTVDAEAFVVVVVVVAVAAAAAAAAVTDIATSDCILGCPE